MRCVSVVFCKSSSTLLLQFVHGRTSTDQLMNIIFFASLPNSTTRTPASDTGYEHDQRTSSQQVVDVVQHVRSRLNLLHNILPATDTTNGRAVAHNNSTTCCTTNSPPTDKNLPHHNMLRCWALALRCDKFVMSSSLGGGRWCCCTTCP